MNNAYVVGYGIIDALGNNPKDCFQRMLDDNDYSSDIPSMLEENLKVYRGYQVDESTLVLPEGWSNKGVNLSQKLAMHSAMQALEMANLPHSSNVAVIYSTTTVIDEALEEFFPKLLANKRINPRTVINRIPDMTADHISSYWKFMGVSAAVLGSCATGILSIDYAMRLLDEYDYVVCGSGDAGTFRVAMKSFSSGGALGNNSKPFDDDREGFVMGSGAGVLILASAKSVEKYGSKVYATLYPAGLASDAYDQTSPAADGRGSRLALSKATASSVTIDAVSAHATSTPTGDIIEYASITDYFGKIPIYAPKSKIGHALAGSGMIETIYAIESMTAGIIPHIQNLNNASMDTHNCLVRTNTPFEDKPTLRTLNNSFGFGGKCASQIIEVTRHDFG
jgi:3-oxoacyl-[acyl-carrier-protein] synthase II